MAFFESCTIECKCNDDAVLEEPISATKLCHYLWQFYKLKITPSEIEMPFDPITELGLFTIRIRTFDTDIKVWVVPTVEE